MSQHKEAPPISAEMLAGLAPDARRIIGAVVEHYETRIAELERRLRGRATESEEAIQRRLEVARRELARAHTYQFQVVNNAVDEAVDEICQILTERGLKKK